VEEETMVPLLVLLLVLLCAASTASLTAAQGLPFGDLPGRLPTLLKDVGKGLSAPRHAPPMDPQTPDAAPSRERLDINSASLEALQALPGIDAITAQHIIDGRPYRGTADLMVKHILSQATYDKIAHRLVATQDATTATAPPQKVIRTQRDVAELSAKFHPDEKWGYLNILKDRGDNVGEHFSVKVANTVPDGALLTVPFVSNLPERDRFYKEGRGYVRRGKGQEGLDLFEIVAVRHEASPGLKRTQYYKDRPDGWESLADLAHWTGRPADYKVLLSK
jgi:hypothetical protein